MSSEIAMQARSASDAGAISTGTFGGRPAFSTEDYSILHIPRGAILVGGGMAWTRVGKDKAPVCVSCLPVLKLIPRGRYCADHRPRYLAVIPSGPRRLQRAAEEAKLAKVKGLIALNPNISLRRVQLLFSGRGQVVDDVLLARARREMGVYVLGNRLPPGRALVLRAMVRRGAKTKEVLGAFRSRGWSVSPLTVKRYRERFARAEPVEEREVAIPLVVSGGKRKNSRRRP